MTQDELLDRCRQGDRQAQRELYDLNADRVYRLLLRMTGNPEDASELAQETFLRAYAALDQFDARASLHTWIYQIALNEGRQFLRRSRRREIKLAEVETASEVEADITTDIRLDITAALDLLPEEEKTLLVLRYYEQQSYDQMAIALDKPPGTIASGLNRARRLLLEKLSS